jgi:hypothetical protein
MSAIVSNRATRIAIVLAVLVAIICAADPASRLRAAPASPAAGPNTVYLSMIMAGGSTTPPSTPTPPPADDSGAFFMQPHKKIAGPSIKVDAQGGLHLAYYDAVPLADKPAATYAYCPAPSSQCANASKWSYLSMGDQIDEVQLQLTPEGHPRLLIGYHDTAKFLEAYIYGECNSNCTASEAAWSFVAVTLRSLNATSIGASYLPNRTFALDPQGRPAFVLYDQNTSPEPDHTGGYYFSCQTSCTKDGSWSEVRFTQRGGYYDELLSQPVLQFTTDGQPRILALLYPLNGTGASGIYYFACDGGCDDQANWQRTLVADRGNGPYPAWDLEIDGQNRPRATFYKYDASDSTRQTLFYLWCDTNCLDNSSWHTLDLGLPKGDGIGADIELDAAGRPRIAYLNDFDLGYAWCNNDCTSAAGWQHGYADNDQTMEQEYPIALPFTCSSGIWDSYSPSLALDTQGNPRIAYDASYKAYCQYQDPTDPTKPPTNEFHEIWHSVRTIFTNQP